jgi:hypothetical protein
MAAKAPIVGEWYSDQDTRQLFEIVAFDDQALTVEVQYVDGEVSEFDLDTWHALNLELAAPPEDWSASYEVSPEDVDFNDLGSEYLSDPLATLEPESMLGFDEYY